MKKYNLCPLDSAIRQIHFPDSREDIEIARKRLIFEELLTLQIGLMKLKDKKETTNNYKIKTDFTNEFLTALPFNRPAHSRERLPTALPI